MGSSVARSGQEEASSEAGLRLLFLNYEYPPLGGGAGVATAALAEQLAARGARVDVVTTAVGASGERETPRPGLEVHRVGTGRTSVHHAGMADAARYLVRARPVARRLLREARAAGAPYDVVQCYFSLPTGALLPFLGLHGVPTVVSLRGSDVPGYDPTDRTLQRMHRVLRPLTRRIWRSAGRVVALSESLGRLASATDPGLAYDVIRNGVDVALFRPPAPPRAPRTDRIRCLAVARLVARKGLTDLLHGFATLAADQPGRFELEIVGRGRGEAALRALAARLGVADAVRFVGALDHAAVAERYRQADLFTLPSWEESFGNVFAEALASGLPIVGTRVGGIPEFVAPEVNGLLVPPHRPDLLAAAIRRLADDPAQRETMGRQNRQCAETELSWDAVADRYLAVYARLRPPRPQDHRM